MTPFSAVLLAGGRSQRMGHDKAMLTLPDGWRLWERQLSVLRELEPTELFISGPARAGFPAGVTTLEDKTPELGPLGGIITTLETMQTKHLVVLAIDLPVMTTAYLRVLLVDSGERSEPGGVIPQNVDGFFEPLAAIYPKASLLEARTIAETTDRSLQGFVRRLISLGMVGPRPILTEESGLFVNWNRWEDFRA